MLRFVAVASLAAFVIAPLAHATDFALSGTNTTIGFVGTKPGFKHDGGFKAVTGTASVKGTDATSLKITLDIDMNSLYSDEPKLTKHLMSPDFFGVKSNPKSKFVTSKVEKSGDDYKVTGTLTMLGKDKEISFPAKISASGDSLTVTSSFSIDRTQWGMTYGQGKVDNTVKLTVNVKAKS